MPTGSSNPRAARGVAGFQSLSLGLSGDCQVSHTRKLGLESEQGPRTAGRAPISPFNHGFLFFPGDIRVLVSST